MRTVIVGTLSVGRHVLIPVSIIILPVREPVLLGISIHRLEVESTVVSDETFEALVVMTGKIVNREATERSAHATQTVFIDIRQVGCCVVNGAEIVVHALACPVATDLLVPLRTEAGKATTVRCYDDIAVSGHDGEVPTIAPEL